jgi:hypothetical protein
MYIILSKFKICAHIEKTPLPPFSSINTQKLCFQIIIVL